MTRRDPMPCPDGFPEETVVRLAVLDLPEPERDRALSHLEECDACALAYVEYSRILRTAADLSAAPPARSPAGRSPFLLRRSPLRFAAALLVALLAGYALGQAFRAPAPVLVGTGPGGLRRAGEMGLRMGLDFASAGVPPGARVDDWCPFVVAGAGPGTLVAVARERGGGADLVAFGADGRWLWSASGAWADWADTLGAGYVRVLGMKNLVTRRVGDRLEETIVVLARRTRVQALFFVDPVTGRKKGEHYMVGRFHLGDAIAEGVAALPEGGDAERRLGAAVAFGLGEEAVPGILVMETTGRVLQRIELPTPRFHIDRPADAQGLMVDWSRDAPRVMVRTSETLHLTFDVGEDGLLRLPPVGVAPTDNVPYRYDLRFGEGAWEELTRPFGGTEGYYRELGRRVRVVDAPALPGWRRP